MNNTLITLRAAAEELGVPQHVVTYAIVTRKVEEPLRISGRRMFSAKDIENLRRHFNHAREVRWGGRANGNH